MIFFIDEQTDSSDVFDFVFIRTIVNYYLFQSDADPEVKLLAKYAFVHYYFPLNDKPNLVNRLPVESQDRLFGDLAVIFNKDVDSKDYDPLYLFLGMYSVLYLNMTSRYRLNYLRDFFFVHIQSSKQSEQVKGKILNIFALIGESNPKRYGIVVEGETIVQFCQNSLLVSCPWLQGSLINLWIQLVDSFIEKYKTKKLQTIDLETLKK
uniref:Uncharacterized protein n=1 Tax=Coptotermes formosanus TaxID=36987 RepID=R4V0M6_COPFO|nr:hypothetical protein [Coptotermes formosanus]